MATEEETAEDLRVVQATSTKELAAEEEDHTEEEEEGTVEEEEDTVEEAEDHMEEVAEAETRTAEVEEAETHTVEEDHTAVEQVVQGVNDHLTVEVEVAEEKYLSDQLTVEDQALSVI